MVILVDLLTKLKEKFDILASGCRKPQFGHFQL